MASTVRSAERVRGWGVAVILCAACFLLGCHPVSRSNFEKIEIGSWTRESVHELFGDPAERPANVVMPDREVYYQDDRLDRSYIIVYYDDEGRVIWKEWKRPER